MHVISFTYKKLHWSAKCGSCLGYVIWSTIPGFGRRFVGNYEKPGFVLFLNFLGLDEIECIWHVGRYFACCTSPGLWMMVNGMIGKGNLPQCRLFYDKSHSTWSGLELLPPRWEATTRPYEEPKSGKSFSVLRSVPSFYSYLWLLLLWLCLFTSRSVHFNNITIYTVHNISWFMG